MLFLVKRTLESLWIPEHLIVLIAGETIMPWHRVQEARLESAVFAMDYRIAGPTSVDLPELAVQTP